MSVDDSIWEKLEKTIEENQEKAHNQVANIPIEKVKELRKRCKTDLYFLTTAILGYHDLSVNLHGDLCNWLFDTRHDRFRLTLLPRGHFKSTVKTISHCIQIALPNDDDIEDAYPQSLGTNCRILITHETQEGASSFLYPITQHFTSNPLLMGLFPECVPDPKKQRINKSQLDLPRSQIRSEPTFDTMGVGARAQGRHYDYIKCDDLIGDKARDSKVEMQGAKEWVDNIQSFFSAFGQDKLDFIGTRWAVDDLYSHIMEVYGPKLKVYCRSVEEWNPVTKKKEAIFPERFTPDTLAIIKRNRKVWNAQYLNDPKEGHVEFEDRWKKYFYFANAETIHIPSKERKDDLYIPISDLEKLILIDPAGDTGGKTAILVTGTDFHNPYKVYTLQTIQASLSTPELTNTVFSLVKKWNPRAVIIEEVLFSKLLQTIFKMEMTKRHQTFRIIGARTKQKEKAVRVRGLANWFIDGRIYFNEKQQDLIYQYDNFGAIKEYHLLDVLAYGPEYWRTSKRMEDLDEEEDKEYVKLSERCPVTGYSNIEYGES